MPKKWQQNFNFSWNHSYNEWIQILKVLEFTVSIEETPHIEIWQNRKTLSAELLATSKTGNTTIELDFDYGNDNGEGYTITSLNSLYSMGITIKSEDPICKGSDTSPTPEPTKKTKIITSTQISTKGSITWYEPDEDEYYQKNYQLNQAQKNQLPIKIKIKSRVALSLSDTKLTINKTTGAKLGHANLEYHYQNKEGFYIYTYSRELAFEEGGEYVVQLWVDKGNFSSVPLKVNYQLERIKLHTIAIGTDPGDLRYTINDAQDFSKIFYQHPLYQSVEQQIITGTSANGTQIELKLKQLEYLYQKGEISNRDMIVIFLSGHGTTKDDKFYFEANDFNQLVFDRTTFGLENIIEQLKNVPCKKLLFLDACHSGYTPEETLGIKDRERKSARRVLNNLLQPIDGWIVISSSGAEPSWEHPNWENGAFTEAIIEGFKDGAAEQDKEGQKGYGYISIQELYDYINKRVPQLLKRVKFPLQHPTIYGNLDKELEIYQWKK